MPPPPNTNRSKVIVPSFLSFFFAEGFIGFIRPCVLSILYVFLLSVLYLERVVLSDSDNSKDK